MADVDKYTKKPTYSLIPFSFYNQFVIQDSIIMTKAIYDLRINSHHLLVFHNIVVVLRSCINSQNENLVLKSGTKSMNIFKVQTLIHTLS